MDVHLARACRVPCRQMAGASRRGAVVRRIVHNTGRPHRQSMHSGIQCVCDVLRRTAWGPGKLRLGPQKGKRKEQQLAFTRALSDKIAGGQVTVIEKFDLAEPKTKMLTATLKKLGADRSALIVLDQHEEKVMLAARNLQKVDVVSAEEVDVYSLLLYRTLVATKAGFAALTARMTTKKTEVGA